MDRNGRGITLPERVKVVTRGLGHEEAESRRGESVYMMYARKGNE